MIAQKGIWNTFLTVWRAWLSIDYSVINRIISMSLTKIYQESSQSWGVFIVLHNTATSSVYKLGVLYTGGNCNSPRHPHSASILNIHNTHVLSRCSCVQLFGTLWTVACQAPLSMGFPRQEYWIGLPCPSPGDLPNPGIEPTFSIQVSGEMICGLPWRLS